MIKIATALAAACSVKVALELRTAVHAQVYAQQNIAMAKLVITMMKIRASLVNVSVIYAASGTLKA